MAKLDQGVVYDATTMSLFLKTEEPEFPGPVPRPRPNEVVIYYHGWDFDRLLRCPMGKRLLEKYTDAEGVPLPSGEPGYYRYIPRVRDSDHKNPQQQMRHLQSLHPDFQPAPVAIAATALMVHLYNQRENLMFTDFEPDWLGDRLSGGGQYDSCRCAEGEGQIGLILIDKTVRLMRDAGAERKLWLSACAKIND